VWFVCAWWGGGRARPAPQLCGRHTEPKGRNRNCL